MPETDEGEFKKRLSELQYIEDSSIVNSYEMEKLFGEAKKDFGLDRLIFSKEQMEKQLNSGSLTQTEKSFVQICLKLIYWFGESK